MTGLAKRSPYDNGEKPTEAMNLYYFYYMSLE